MPTSLITAQAATAPGPRTLRGTGRTAPATPLACLRRRGWLFFRIALWAMAVMLIASILLTGVLSLLGRSPYIVRGTSMQPTIPPGSLVLTRSVSPSEVRPLDVVVVAPQWAQLRTQPTRIIHRVVRVTPTEDGVLGYTWGDGTALPDPEPALLREDVPVVEMAFPLLGYLYGLLPPGAASLLALLLMPLLLLTTSPRSIARATARLSPALR